MLYSHSFVASVSIVGDVPVFNYVITFLSSPWVEILTCLALVTGASGG